MEPQALRDAGIAGMDKPEPDKHPRRYVSQSDNQLGCKNSSAARNEMALPRQSALDGP